MTHATKPSETCEWTDVHTARLHLSSFLGLVASDPRSERWARLEQDELLDAAHSAASFLARQSAVTPDDLGPGENDPATLDLGPLVTALRAPRDELIAEFDLVFGLVASKECPTYETDYCTQTFSVYRSQQLADVAGYYAAFGLRPSRDAAERVDHVALEIEFMAWLLAKERHALRSDNPQAEEQAEICRDAQKSFGEAHLAWWIPAFAHALEAKTTGTDGATCGYLYQLAAVLSAWIPIERAALGIQPPTELVAANPTEQDELSCGDCQGEAGGEAPVAG